MLDLLRAKSTRRLLIWSTALAAIVMSGVHFGLNVFAFGQTDKWALASYQTALQITGGLVAGIATTAFLLFLTRWLVRSESAYDCLRLLTASESNKEHLSQMATTHTWFHNGHIGRWVRTEVLPAFKQAARSQMVDRTVELILLDPDNSDLMEAFADHRILMDGGSDDLTIQEMIEDTRREVLTTILNAAIAEQHDVGLRVRVYLRNNLDFVRTDLTEHCAFNTVARPFRNAVVHYNVPGNADMYNVYMASFKEARRESRRLDLRGSLVSRDSTAEQLRDLIVHNGIAAPSSVLLASILALSKSTTNAYSSSR